MNPVRIPMLAITLIVTCLAVPAFGNSEDLFSRANEMLGRGDIEGTIEILQAALDGQTVVDEPRAHFYIGYCHEMAQRYPEAIKAYEASLAVDPGFLSALEYGGNLYISAGIDYKAGADLLYRAAMLSSQNYLVYLQLAWYRTHVRFNMSQAVTWLEMAFYYASFNSEQFAAVMDWLKTDSDMDRIRSSTFYLDIISDNSSWLAGLTRLGEAVNEASGTSAGNAAALLSGTAEFIRTGTDFPNGYLAALALYYAGYYHSVARDTEAALLEYDTAGGIFDLLFGRESVLSANMDSLLANMYIAMERYDEASVLLYDVLSVYERELGETHQYVATVFNQLGTVLKYLQQWENALEIQHDTLDMYIATLGEGHEYVALTCEHIADIHYNLGDVESSISWFERATAIREALDRGYDGFLVSNYQRLGEMYGDRGALQKAVEAWRSVVNGEEMSDSPDFQVVYGALYNLFELYDSLGMYIDSYDALQRAVELGQSLFDAGERELYVINNNMGYAAAQLNRYDEALQWYARALDMIQRVGGEESLDVAGTFMNIGKASLSSGAYQHALAHFEQALMLYRKLPGTEPGMLASAGNNLGVALDHLGRYDEAIRFFDEAYTNYLTAGMEESTATLLVNKASVYSSLGKFDEVESLMLEAERILFKKESPDREVLAGLYFNFGTRWSQFDNNLVARKYLIKSLELYRELRDNHPLAGNVMNMLGHVSTDLGALEEAASWYDEAAIILRLAWGDTHPELASNSNGRGQLHEKLGDYTAAIEYYFNAYEILGALYPDAHPDVAATLNNIGYCYSKMGQNDQAIMFQVQARQVYQELYGDNHFEMADLYNTMGLTSTKVGAYDNAIAYHEKALAIKKQYLGEDHYQVAVVYNDTGLSYQESGDLAKALQYFEKALEIKQKHLEDGHSSLATAWNNVALVQAALGDDMQAVVGFKRAIKGYERSLGADHVLTANARNNLAVSLLRLEDYQGAKRELLLAVRNIEKNRNRVGGSYRERASLQSRSVHVYRLLVYALYHTGEYEEAFSWLELSKSRSLADELFRRQALTAVSGDSETYKQLREVKDSLAALRLLIAEKIEKMVSITDEQRRLVELQRQERRLERGLEREVGSLDAAPVVDLRKIQQQLAGDELLVEYSITDDAGSWMFLVTRRSLEMVPINIDFDQPEHLVDSFRACLTDPGQQFFMDRESNSIITQRGLAVEEKKVMKKIIRIKRDTRRVKIGSDVVLDIANRQLYDTFARPFIDRYPGVSVVTIVADGMLSFLPFEALCDQTGSYLVERLDIAYAPSAAMLYRSRQLKPVAGGRLLAMGGAIYNSTADSGKENADLVLNEDETDSMRAAYEQSAERADLHALYSSRGYTWSNLPGTLREVGEIGGIFYSNPAQQGKHIFTGSAVTEELVKELQVSGRLDEYTYIHLATHGITDPLLPELSSIVLSLPAVPGSRNEDGYLTMAEIMTLDLRADLVTLSACETGLGQLLGGEGVIGLAQSFIIAGAKNMAVSLWQVADDATLEFMVSFYRRIKAGIDFRTALAETKREFIGGRWSSPYYWSAFILYGE
jgi:tetratricopeptide (TPR) repeat protein